MLLRPALMPTVRSAPGDEIGDAGVALPPVLMGVAEAPDDRREQRGLRRVGDVPQLLRFVGADIPVGPQKIPPTLLAMRQHRAAAHANHLRTRLRDGAWRPWDVKEKLGGRHIADIDDRGAVGLDLAGQRILHIAAEIAVVEDMPAILIDDRAAGRSAGPGYRPCPQSSRSKATPGPTAWASAGSGALGQTRPRHPRCS